MAVRMWWFASPADHSYALFLNRSWRPRSTCHCATLQAIRCCTLPYVLVPLSSLCWWTRSRCAAELLFLSSLMSPIQCDCNALNHAGQTPALFFLAQTMPKPPNNNSNNNTPSIVWIDEKHEQLLNPRYVLNPSNQPRFFPSQGEIDLRLVSCGFVNGEHSLHHQTSVAVFRGARVSMNVCPPPVVP